LLATILHLIFNIQMTEADPQIQVSFLLFNPLIPFPEFVIGTPKALKCFDIRKGII